MEAMTKNIREAAQFNSKKEAIAAARTIPGFGPSDVTHSEEIMGFRLWFICDPHMSYISKEFWKAHKAERAEAFKIGFMPVVRPV
jgi:hypothetical protein